MCHENIDKINECREMLKNLDPLAERKLPIDRQIPTVQRAQCDLTRRSERQTNAYRID